jgi:hypothetical protein
MPGSQKGADEHAAAQQRRPGGRRSRHRCTRLSAVAAASVDADSVVRVLGRGEALLTMLLGPREGRWWCRDGRVDARRIPLGEEAIAPGTAPAAVPSRGRRRRASTPQRRWNCTGCCDAARRQHRRGGDLVVAPDGRCSPSPSACCWHSQPNCAGRRRWPVRRHAMCRRHDAGDAAQPAPIDRAAPYTASAFITPSAAQFATVLPAIAATDAGWPPGWADCRTRGRRCDLPRATRMADRDLGAVTIPSCGGSR